MKPRLTHQTDYIPLARTITVPVTTMETYTVQKPVMVMEDRVIEKPKVIIV